MLGVGFGEFVRIMGLVRVVLRGSFIVVGERFTRCGGALFEGSFIPLGRSLIHEVTSMKNLF